MSTNCVNYYNPSDIRLLIDDVDVPLKVFNVFSPFTDLMPKDPYWRLMVNGYLGRTFKMEVKSIGWNLKNFTPPLVCYPTLSMDSILNQFDNIYNGTCYQGRLANLTMNPGPPKSWNFGGVFYSGKRDDNSSNCQFQITFPITREYEGSTPCEILCQTETVNIPSSRLQELVTDTGIHIPIPGYEFTECSPDSSANRSCESAIKKALMTYAGGCSDPGLKVTLNFNNTVGKCLTLKIENSPVKLRKVKLGDTLYPFNIFYC